MEKILSDLVFKIRTGCVISRFKSSEHDIPGKTYKMLTLRSVTNEGNLNISDIESFSSKKDINDEFITKYGDVVVRLREPIKAVFIDKDLEGIVVPSLFSIIKTNEEILNPRYLQQFINGKNAQRQLSKEMTNTAICIVKNSELGKLLIPVKTMELQKDIANLSELLSKEIDLQESIIKKKKIFKNEIIEKLINVEKENYYENDTKHSK